MANSFRGGLVSITFRQLSVPQIVTAVADAGLAAVEWGGDVHVPPGDSAAARTARRLTEDAGLAVAAYGSYFRCDNLDDADAVLTTAADLGAPTVRVWAGRLGSAAADARHVARVTETVAGLCDRAAPLGLTVTLEYHGGTLTDTLASTLALLAAVNRPNLLSGWQPRDGASPDAGAAELRRLRPHVGNLHVFQWWPDHTTRRPLADGAERWATYLQAAAEDGRPRFALLEFVFGDDVEQFQRDAATLNSLVGR